MSMKTVALPDGKMVPALGQGTWNMGDSAETRAAEIAALREGIEHGMTLIDTAEMYGDGRSETLVGEAIADVRDQVFLVSKALPQNASRARLRTACEASLERLAVEQLDLYLLHWRGQVPLAETVEAMEQLVADGLIARWGVSNLDADDMAELHAAGGAACATDQILYNLTRRGPELDLLPWLTNHQIPIMAYSPVEQGRLLGNATLRTIAAEFDATPAQVALAWVLRDPSMIAIPKAGSVAHVRDNHAALHLMLDRVLLERLEAAFPRPGKPRPLEML